MQCRKCGNELIPLQNWTAGNASRNIRICKFCASKEAMRLYAQKRGLTLEEFKKSRKHRRSSEELKIKLACRNCDALLNDATWWPSCRKRRNYICITCMSLNAATSQNKHRDKRAAHAKIYRVTNELKMKTYATSYRKGIKIEALAIIGGKCVHCEETRIEFLTAGHKNNDGAEWLRLSGVKRHGGTTYNWIIRNTDLANMIFQVECWNYNCSKQYGREVDLTKPRPHRKNAEGHSNPEYLKYNHQYWRAKCLDHYGWACMCCDDADSKHLTLGHPNKDGGRHRKMIGEGTSKFRRLCKSGFNTPFKIETQCYNCNMGAAVNAGICPHKIKDSLLTAPFVPQAP